MPEDKIGLEGVADPFLLKALWKRPIRRRLRSVRFPEFVLGHDPMEWAWTEYEIDEIAAQIASRVVAGSYRASPVESVRAAKAVGLTRPLSYLSVSDSILYRAIVSRAEKDLLAGFPRWARFGRGDVDDDTVSAAESGWFRAWLARQSQHWVISGKYGWLVETDVANFFPYVDLNSVVQHVLSHSRLSEDSVRLLFHMLRGFSPMRSYRISRVGGLPQEPLDSSRILAHAYLRAVDEALATEGDEERYTRWVDDILIGAATREEGLQQIRRVQIALEHLGLYPNASKTRILPSVDFTRDYMKAENDYLGEIDEALQNGKPIDKTRFHLRLHGHLLSKPRPKGWGRVLRRYYSASRATGDVYLMRWWPRHLKEAPDSAAQILEYLSTFRITEARLDKLDETLNGFGGVYEDIELLAREYAVVAPNVGSAALRVRLCNWALQTIEANVLTNPRLAASAALVVGKFGADSELDTLRVEFGRRMISDSILRQQSAVILYASGRLIDDELLTMAVGSSSETVSHVRFLRALAAGDRSAVGIAIGLAQPIPRKRPVRSTMRPRAIFLLPLIARGDPKRWKSVGSRWLDSLQHNDGKLRDAATERWIRDLL